MTLKTRSLLFASAILPLSARVISYSPYTDRVAIPAGSGDPVRSNRHGLDSGGRRRRHAFSRSPRDPSDPRRREIDLRRRGRGSPGDTLEILGAIADPGFRTNIGLVDASQFPTTGTHQVRMEIIDATGKTADSFTAPVPAARGTQLNDIFRARDLDVTGPVLIRISPLSGVIGGYATMTDNGTNDSIYLAANLAAEQNQKIVWRTRCSVS